MTQALTEADANSTWARDAIEQHGDTLPEETVKKIMDLRFTEKRVAYDPTDPEANKLAVSKGYVVVHGSQMSGAEWDAAKRVGSIFAAGKVTPSPKPYSDDPNAPKIKLVKRENWTPAMERVASYAQAVAVKIMGVNIVVDYANDFNAPFSAAYGSRHLRFNVAKLGYKWFERDMVPISDLIIHEFGHEYSGDHLSSEYHDALTLLGAKLAKLALVEPKLFDILKA